jgi:NitT/TauT family transport system substrate-binding protein
MIAALLRALMDRVPNRRAAMALLLAVTAVLVGCTRSTPNVSSALIRLGTYEWPGSYWIDVAYKKGWFAEAGLNVERVDTDRKYFKSLDDVAAGTLDGMGFSQFDLVRYVAAGHDLVGVVAIDYSEGAEALVARPGFERLQDLRGKRIALHRGTYLEYLLTIIAERESFDIESVTLIDRSGDQAIADLKAGKVEAVLVWEPYAQQAQEAVRGVKLFSTTEFPGLTYNVMTMRRDFIKARPHDVAALLKVWQRSVQFIREHPDETCEIIAELFHEPVSSAKDMMRTDRILDLADNSRAFSYAAGFESLHGSWRRMNDFQIERGLAARRVDSPGHLDSRFVRALE